MSTCGVTLAGLSPVPSGLVSLSLSRVSTDSLHWSWGLKSPQIPSGHPSRPLLTHTGPAAHAKESSPDALAVREPCSSPGTELSRAVRQHCSLPLWPCFCGFLCLGRAEVWPSWVSLALGVVTAGHRSAGGNPAGAALTTASKLVGSRVCCPGGQLRHSHRKLLPGPGVMRSRAG